MSDPTTRVRTIAWRGLDDPERFDVARFVFSPDSDLHADGSSVTPAYVLRWGLVTARDWITTSMLVDVHGQGWSRSLLLMRPEGGRWQAWTTTEGEADLPGAGLDDAEELNDAVDCDLELCPATNVMPILRLGLTGTRPKPRSDFPVALVEVPSLRVVRSDQAYEPVTRSPDGGSVVVFSAEPDFHARLEVDRDGIVTHYPGLADAIV
jgi:uncharacterized protein